MKKLLLVVAVMLSSISVAQAKWHHYAIGGAIGYLLAQPSQAQQPQQQQVAPTQPQPVLPSNHSILMCDSYSGLYCLVGNDNLSPAQFAYKAGYKKIYRTMVIPKPNSSWFYIQMEVSN